MEKIKVLICNQKKIYDKLINESDMYGLIFYPFEELHIKDNVYIVYSKDATRDKEKIFFKNRTIKGREIYGTFIVVAKEKNKYISLTEQQLKEVLYLI